MRWRTHNPGDRRLVRRFAWLPTVTHSGAAVWLELYSVLQVFVIRSEFEGWEDVERRAD